MSLALKELVFLRCFMTFTCLKNTMEKMFFTWDVLQKMPHLSSGFLTLVQTFTGDVMATSSVVMIRRYTELTALTMRRWIYLSGKWLKCSKFNLSMTSLPPPQGKGVLRCY